MPKNSKAVARLKGLNKHLQNDEEPVMSIPGIWDNGQTDHSTACDIVLTNQRIFGYYFVSFPRERLFLDALPLATIRAVTLRQKNFEPIFRELMVSSAERKVYIRAPRQKIEMLNEALRVAIAGHTSNTGATFAATEPEQAKQPPIYGRQEIRRQFENSPLGITTLFSGGLLLEVVGAMLWSIMHSAQIGLPLIVAGFVAWLSAILLRRKRT